MSARSNPCPHPLVAALTLCLAVVVAGCGGTPGIQTSSNASPRSDGQVAVAGLQAVLGSESGTPTSRTIGFRALALSPGQEFLLPVAVSDAANVAGAALSLTYDKSVFACTGVTAASGVSSGTQIVRNASTGGTAAIAVASVQPLTATGGVLATFAMKVLPTALPQNATFSLTGVIVDERGNMLGRLGTGRVSGASSRPQQTSSGGLIGDLMGTGQPEIGSAIKILRVVVGLDPAPTADKLWQWDCNLSKAVDIGDAIKILRCLVGLDVWPISGTPIAPATYVFSRKWAINAPHSVATASGNLFFLAGDVTGRIVTRYGVGGNWVTSWGAAGNLSSLLNDPNDIAADGLGKVYVSCVGQRSAGGTGPANSFILRFSDYGDPQAQIYPTGVPTPVGTTGVEIHGLAVQSSGLMYATIACTKMTYPVNGGPPYLETLDTFACQIRADGHYLAKWGSLASAGGQFYAPTAIAVAPSGAIYVIDGDSAYIIDATGRFAGTLGAAGSMSAPQALAVSSVDGNVFVADTGNNRVLQFTPAGQLAGTWGTPGTGDGQFADPEGITVGADRSVYVSDTGHNRVQVFTPAP